MGRKSHGQLRSFRTKRQLGAREPNIAHANLALQPESAGKPPQPSVPASEAAQAPKPAARLTQALPGEEGVGEGASPLNPVIPPVLGA